MKEETLLAIGKYPTVYNDFHTGDAHESTLRSWHILDHVLTMVRRGDSKETILEMADILKHLPEPPKQ